MRKPPIIILLFFTTFCFAQHQVDPNLFGITAETTFIFYDVDDTSFTNKVLQISPKILTFPGSNFYHFGKVGYGFDLDEIDAWHKKGYPKRVRGLLRNTQQRGHNHDYIDDFIKLARKTKSKAIIMANIITAKPEETIQIIKKIKENGVDIVGVEMGGELSNESYKHRMDYQRYISLAKKHAEETEVKNKE